MSTTIEKVVGPRRSRLAMIDAAIEADEQALEATRRKFVELAETEDRAVREAKRKNPTSSPFKLGEPAQVARAEAEKLDRTIAGLEKGLAALQSERAVAAAEQASRELKERVDEARDLSAKEREARVAAAKAFATMVDRWNSLADVLSRKSELAAQVGREQLVGAVGPFDRDTIETWEQVSGFLVAPVPVDLEGFLAEAIVATTGDRPDEVEDAANFAELNEFRRRNDLPLETRSVTPSARELADCWPDLRDGKIATAQVDGVAIRRRASSEPPWPEAA